MSDQPAVRINDFFALRDRDLITNSRFNALPLVVGSS